MSVEALPKPSIPTPMPVQSSSSLSSSSSSKTLQIDPLAQTQLETPSLADQRALLGKIQVTKVQSFGDYHQYRSPRKALFLSLLLPGAGQAYVGGTSNWVRAALYLGAEAGLWGTWYQYSIAGLQDYQDKAKALEKAQWSDSLYENLNYKLRQSAKAQNPQWAQTFAKRYQESPSRTEWCFALFGSNDNLPDFNQCVNQDAAEFGSSYLPKVSNSNFKAFYPNNHSSMIAQADMVWGWRDASGPRTLEELKLDAATKTALGQSQSQNVYSGYLDQIKKRREMSSTLLGAIAINHLVSAIDAAISAKYHNRGLYQSKSGPKLSFATPLQWQNGAWTPSLQLALEY